jgi:ATP-dependent Clp protease ATP-binding subunit ClpA
MLRVEFEEGRKIIAGSGGNPDKLKKIIEEFFITRMEQVDVDEPRQSVAFQNVMERAIWHSASSQKNVIELGDVLVSIFDEEKSICLLFLCTEE